MTLDLKALRDGVVQFGSTALSSARVIALIDELTEAREFNRRIFAKVGGVTPGTGLERQASR